VLDRFGQIAPRLLFAADVHVYAGKHHGLEDRIHTLAAAIPSIEHVVVYPHRGPEVRHVPGLVRWSELLSSGGDTPLRCERLPFAHPLAILYTSGTTGVPKCIVHSAGGTLLKHLEELVLQVDLRPADVLFYFTTCGWMMWNWLASGLATGAAIVIYDGSPLHPDPGRLFRLIDRSGITVFGTSPRFLASVESSGLEPRSGHSLATLRTVLSTGSPLHAAQYEWVYRALKADVHLASISGGTDLIGCFVLGSLLHPVRSGEIACRALGMRVESRDEEGRTLAGEKGELVCTAPFPSMPVSFWNDADGAKYRSAYFSRFPGVWHHGDFIEIHPDGASVIHGRSDATLNPGGVRIGTAEIYRALAAVKEVVDALAVPREVPGDVRIALFVVLAPGAALDETLERRIRTTIRSAASPRHVPHEIHAIREVPRTVSGKAVELAVARVLRGEEVNNREALANPEALEQFRRFSRSPGKP
jgi:acetoacetyl-CoA synthetase